MANTAGGRLMRIPAREMAASVDKAMGVGGESFWGSAREGSGL
jgi:hypothetical protein